MFRVLAFVSFFLWMTASAGAQLRVVATTSSMGMLVRTVGGEEIDVTVLAPPDRDAHYLLARPSMILALRRADLLVAVGADLEIGWLPAALRSAGNGDILPGQSGYFEGAAQLVLIERDQPADRSLGDIHPEGNPHFYMDPERMASLAGALADRLADLDGANGVAYRARAQAFQATVAARVPMWQEGAAGTPGVVLYHRDATYLAAFLNVPVLGYIEPVPGIPPTASHLRDLVQRLSGRQGTILHSSFQSSDGPQFLARNVGWKRIQLQLEVPLDADGNDYLDHIGQWVDAFAGTAP